MSKIVPKLDLNKTPQNVENGSMIFAKNIRILPDNTIGADCSIKRELFFGGGGDYPYTYEETLLGQIVGLNNTIYYFVKFVPQNDLLRTSYKIYKYNELTGDKSEINSAWKWSGGIIDGLTTINNTGEEIITINEYSEDGSLNVPLKHINVERCSSYDDESIYTQTPNIPLTNLTFDKYYDCNIPAGVYQFFIRYKIRKNFYTSWFPCSKELFTGFKTVTNTAQGGLRHIDKKLDSNKSFKFNVEHINPNAIRNYKEFQIGFIISNEDASMAREWKHFSINTTSILFTYYQEDIKETNIDEFLKSVYDISNVKNVTNFKNKLYISNYKETDFNPNLQTAVQGINIDINHKIFNFETEQYINDKPFEVVDNKIISIGGESISNYFNSENCIINYQFTTNKTDDRTNPQYYQYPLDLFQIKSHILSIDIVDENNNITHILTPPSGQTNPNNEAFLELLSQAPFYDVYKISSKIDENNPINTLNLYINNIKNSITKIDLNTNDFYLKDRNNNDVKLKEIKLSYAVYEFEKEDIEHDLKNKWITTRVQYDVTYTIKFNQVIQTKLKNDFDLRTLVPHSTYNFYIHFVKEDGIATNGYFISNKKIEYDFSTNLNTPHIFYPEFTNINVPNGYKGYFISYCNVGDNIAQCFNLKHERDNKYSIDCLELDTLLYNLNDDITIIDKLGNIISSNAKYYSSGNSTNLKYFGQQGRIEFEYPTNNAWFDSEGNMTPSHPFFNMIFFIKIHRQIINEDRYNLIKLTPYIDKNVSSFNDYTKYNIEGYLCYVSKLLESNYYISGTDVYIKTFSLQTQNLLGLDPYYHSVGLLNDTPNWILSNFNFNYISLTDEIKPQIRSYTIDNPDSGDTETLAIKELFTGVNSLIESSIYELKLTYREYTRKLYQVVNDEVLIEFNNTIRSSNVNTDETYRNIYSFDAEDYYQVPTNRGIIVKLFAVNDYMFIHSEHSLYKFAGTNSLQSESGEVSLQESDPFQTGIKEVFDSQHGHGGLQKKHHGLVSFNAYVFFDKLANKIYAYDNETKTIPISDSINKILNFLKPKDIKFVDDINNNRFIMNIYPSNLEGNVCLSFSFTSKSFISIHDYNFDEAFNSRSNVYLIKKGDNLQIVYKFDNTTFNNYSSCFEESIFKLGENIKQTTNIGNSSIDIIFNNEFETIKTLDSIEWVCSKIIDYFKVNDINLAEPNNEIYGGDYIRIYSDNGHTNLFDLLDAQGNSVISSQISIYTQSQPYPDYFNGVWRFNDYRDITYSQTNPDQQGLIRGKYFVVRFIFKDKNFKLENVKFNVSENV